jgi:hypothetical protein
MRRGRFIWGVAVLAAAVLAVVPSALAAPSHPATQQGYNNSKGGVLPSVSPSKQAAGVQGALASTGRRGGLPFTGLQLWLFALVGTALVGGGVLLKSTARQNQRSRQ